MRQGVSRFLDQYIKKRNFKRTEEPRGEKLTQDSGDFVIHLHGATRLHYDLRLQWKGVLKSWAVPKGPSYNPRDKRLAVRTEDHPDEYKNFEGVIPDHEYGAGPSLIWDAGEFEPLEDFDKGFKKGHLRFRIHGIKMKGIWNLIRLKNETEKENWLLVKEKDEFANPPFLSDISDWPESVATGRSLEELETPEKPEKPEKKEKKNHKAKPAEEVQSPLPWDLLPQLAVRQTELPEGDEWQFERKYDGYRLLVFIENGKVTLKTRNEKDWTSKFPRLVEAFKRLPIRTAVFDGEVIYYDKDGRTNFAKLQNFMSDQDVSVNFVIFDVLYSGGQNLMSYPLSVRRELLERLWSEFPKTDVLELSEILTESKDALKKACQLKWEGIVAKQFSSTYHTFRHKSWVKVKCDSREEFVVIGLTKPEGQRTRFGSILIAERTDKGLVYRGRVGTGYDNEDLDSLYKAFKKMEVKAPPEVKDLDPSNVMMWLKPFYYVEVDYSERTRYGLLRHPVFYGLRQDKEFEEHKLTHPDKVLFKEAGVSKGDLWEYYQKIMGDFLAFNAEAPLTLVRCPRGAESKCFFQKHFDKQTDHPQVVEIDEEKKRDTYAYIRSPEDLKALVQLGALELHVWNSRFSDLEKPRYVVFDLDPDEGMDFSKVTEAAHLVREFLMQTGHRSFVRTTGGKGLHVVAPVREMSWDEAYHFSKEIAHEIVANWPDQYVATMSKEKRKNKVFIDYLRNSRGSTSIANYSTRAKKEATVATPLDWSEVTKDLDPKKFNIHTVPERLARRSKDPWDEFWKL